MPKSIKIKVKEEKEKPIKTPKKVVIEEPTVEIEVEETLPIHHRLAEHDLNLDPWLDQVVADLTATTNPAPSWIEPETTIETVEVEEEELPEIIEPIKEVAPEPKRSNSNSGLSQEKHRALEEMFARPNNESLKNFADYDREEGANPVIMLWGVIRERVATGVGQKIGNFLAAGWWLVPVWLAVELWLISRQQLWHWPNWLWMIISWVWPIVCWFILGWLRSTYVVKSKDFLLSLWPIALISSLLLAVIEVFWLGGAWSWINLISLPLFVLAIVASTSWLLTAQGRLNY